MLVGDSARLRLTALRLNGLSSFPRKFAQLSLKLASKSPSAGLIYYNDAHKGPVMWRSRWTRVKSLDVVAVMERFKCCAYDHNECRSSTEASSFAALDE